ncbi:MAG: Jag N-terminal domain-containing protein, partial [Evtepia sp.]|nr:Jag N-terminal domain-containing protein [Evtepia sp.]
MLKWIEATGRSEDAAIQNALAQLGLDRDSVSVEVLERARSGFLGFGSSPAKVKVTYEVPDEPAAPPAEELFAAPPAPQPKPARTKPPTQKEKEEAPAPQPAPVQAEEPAPAGKGADLEERIRAFLSGLLAHMGVEAEIVIAPKAENGVLVTLEGPKLGALIG